MKSRRAELLADIHGWMPVASGEAKLALTAEIETLCLAFDFHDGGGFVVARKEVKRVLPEAFAIRFKIRGRGPLNHLELKLVDGSGKNVWRYRKKDFHLHSRSREVVATSREFEFAWGPAGGGAISELGAVEVAIVAGEGGTGTVVVSALHLEDQSFAQRPVIQVSSALHGHGKTHVLDGLADTSWRPQVTDKRPWITLDSLSPRVLGGVVVDWREEAPSKGFKVRGSNDGRRWSLLYHAGRAGGKRSFVSLPHAQVRYLRLELSQPVGVIALRVQPFEFSRSTDAFFHAVAAQYPRGWFPRWLMREQSLWTLAGGLMQRTCSLLNEQGMWEPDEGSFVIEPMLSVDGKFHTWADATISRGLKDGWMPVPWVRWEGDGWRLEIEVTGQGSQVRYRMDNVSDNVIEIRLHALVRPFQVTPPWQHFRNVGGVFNIQTLEQRDGALWVNDLHVIKPSSPGGRIGVMNFDEGCLPEMLAGGNIPPQTKVRSRFGYASGVIVYDFSLQPGGTDETVLTVCVTGQDAEPFASAENERQRWCDLLPRDQLKAAGWAGDVLLAQLSAAAHILVTQSGPALQPGPRRYTRSWIRDGTIMSAALLRMGRCEEVRAFIRWYASFQRTDGFVPCCVDRDGVDWLVEHDSHGQLIALIYDDYRFTGDAIFLAEMWPVVCRAVVFIENLREADGLLPVSVSHEGYLAQPVHSFWDDFWALRGLRDAVQAAGVLGYEKDTAHWQKLASCEASAVFAAIEATRQSKGLPFIPASREWADFDPTATANALMLFDVPSELDAKALAWTFEKYMEDWRKKRTGELPWNNYTAYEIRIIGALVRLRKRAEALELLRFFLGDRRPLNWNQWPEISWADPLSPGHIGDVPHTWIAAEYVLAVRCLFAYESETRQSLILAAGVAEEWLEDEGVIVKAMPTYYGLLSYTLKKESPGCWTFQIEAGLKIPPGGLLLRPPIEGLVSVDGKALQAGTQGIVIMQLPAHVMIQVA